LRRDKRSWEFANLEFTALFETLYYRNKIETVTRVTLEPADGIAA
jgi:hypothetical protein